jgi:hypothetical protein
MTAELYDLAAYRSARAFYAGKKPPWPRALLVVRAREDARIKDGPAEACGSLGPCGHRCELEKGHAGLCAASWVVGPITGSTLEVEP